MAYRRYKMLQKYVNGVATDEYMQGELISGTSFPTYNECMEGNQNPDEPIEGDIYQWVTVSGQYVCDGYDKYTKEKQQKSSDQGVTWTDTGATRAGELVEVNSEDCDYETVLKRYEDDEVLFEMYKPCRNASDGRKCLRLRLWNKTENNKMAITLYEEGAYYRGHTYIEPQTDVTINDIHFSCSTFYTTHRYYLVVSKLVEYQGGGNDLYRKYSTGYFSFMCSEIIIQCD